MSRPQVTRTATETPGVRKVTRRYPDGRRTVAWEVRVKDALGKLRNVGTYTDKEAARRASVQARADVQNGEYVPRSAGAVTFLAVAEAWLSSPDVKRLKPSTRGEYERITRTHLEPFHRAHIGRLSYDEISRFIGGLLESKEPATVKYVLHVLRKALDHAVKAGYVRGNPARQVEVSVLTKQAEVTLEPETVELLISSLPSPSDLIVETAASTGLRAGELCGLRKRHLNLTERWLRVTETVQDRTTLLVGTPKSRAGQRIVDDLPADLCQRLAAHVANKADDDYVFGKGDKPLRWRNWTGRVWRPALERLGLKGVRFHDLRHYHASAVLLITADPMYTCRRLGHANPSFTMNAYGHVLKHEGRKVADGLAALRAEGRERAQRTARQERPTSVVDLASYRRSKGA